MLYDDNNRIDFNDGKTRAYVAHELEMSEDEAAAFLEDCASVGLISADGWRDLRIVSCNGVQEELDYRRMKSESGRKGMKKRYTSKEDDE